MSCEYFVECVDCDSRHELGANHGQALMRSLVLVAPAISDFAPAARNIFDGLTLQTLYGRLDLAWFIEHGRHRLRVVDEYGRFDGDCPKRVRCVHCSTEKWCRLPLDHAGGCAP